MVSVGKVKFVGLILLVLLLLVVIGAYLFIQSSFVSEKLSVAASEATGSTVVFGDDITLTGLFPNVSFSVPNARFQPNIKATEGLQRARIQQLRVSLPYKKLFDSEAAGSVNLSMERVSLITQSASDQAKSANDDRDLNVEALQGSATLLAQTLEKLATTPLSVVVDDIDYFLRSADHASTHIRLKDMNLQANDESIVAQALVVWDSYQEQTLSLTIDNLSQEAASGQRTVAGSFNLKLLPSTDNHSALKTDFSFNLSGAKLELTELDINTDWLWLRGASNINWNDTDVQLKAEIELRSLEIAALAKHSVEQEMPAAQENQRLFTFDVFSFAMPMNLSGDVDMYLGAIRLDAMPVVNGQLTTNISNGVITVASDELYILGGESELSLEIDNTLAQLFGFKFKLESDDIELERIRTGNNSQTVLSRGSADTIIALRGEGPSPGHIASSLDGYVLASLENAQINQRYSTMIDRGLLSWAVEKVSLISRPEKVDSNTSLSDPLSLDCASLKVYINDGRAEVSNGAIFDLPENSLFSSGFIDLASEELGFAFRTRSKSLFDWSAISIIKYAELSGTLNEPKATINKLELAKQGVKSASSAAWGPLPSLVYSLAEAGVKNSSNVECVPQIR